MMTDVLKDKEVRDLIARDIKTNLLVEAGAGSGKTSEMANRILSLVSSGYRTIDEIVAITFTRKAANELRERVRHALEQRCKETEDPILKEALEHLHECFIGTIHSFCSKLIRERPIEAGIDPAFVEIEEAEDSVIREKVWELFVSGASEDQKNLLRLMNRYGVKEAVAKNLMKLVCEQQDVEFSLPQEKPGDGPSLDQEIDKAFETLLLEVKTAFRSIPEAVQKGEEEPDALQGSLLRFLQKIRNRREISANEKIMLLSLFATAASVKVTQKKWSEEKEKKQAAKALGEKFAELQEELILPTIALCGSYAYTFLLIPFAKQAKELYVKYKLSTATLNFQDLLLGACRLLRDYPEVRTFFARKYKTLLVDEFQDTDPIQAQMVMYLVGEDIHEKHWGRLIPREGSLFVVGDPKQSIYGFRRADLEIYNRVKGIIARTNGKVVELTTNFRSVTKLGDWFSLAFDSLLNGEVTEDGISQASFSGLYSVTESLAGTLAGVAQYKIDEKLKSSIMAKEPELIARIIHWMVGKQEITYTTKEADGSYIEKKRAVEYKDIMILSTKKKNMEDLAARLASYGIPVKVTGADIIKKAPEFFEFANIIRMIAYPEENAYVCSVMKNDIYGFSDDDLFRYVTLGGIFNIYADLDQKMEQQEGDPEALELLTRVQACFRQLKRFTNYTKYMVPAAATERIAEELGLLGRHVTSDQKLAGLGSFVSLMEKIRQKNIADIWGLDLFITEIRYMIENGFEEETDLEGSDFNAVRIMNTHKAKGLEAPVVILASPYGGRIPEPGFYVQRVQGDADSEEKEEAVEEECYYGYARLKKNPDQYGKEYFAPAAWDTIFPEALRKAALERDRLLYVAATRARNYLIIASSASKENPWEKLLSLLPESTGNLMTEVYADEPEDALPVFKTEAKPVAVDIEKSLAELKRKRDEAMIRNVPTYAFFAPSQSKKEAKSNTENQDLTLERKITENTMAIYLNGEESEVVSGRLELGTAVHKLLETIVKEEEKVDTMIQWIAEKTDSLDEETLHKIASGFRSSILFDRIRKSGEVYTEVPFSVKAENEDAFPFAEREKDCYVTGYIDLIFREEGGWTIVDYKTCGPKEVKHELQSYYQPQLDTYREVWEKTTREKVVGTELFFVEKQVLGGMESGMME